MKSKSIKNKIVTGVILASLMISGGTVVFATDSTNTDNNKSVTQHQCRNNRLQTKLDSLVKAGTITSDQAAAIKDSLKPQCTNKCEKTEKTGKARNPEERKNKLKTKLDPLVTAGTITADQETAILEALIFKQN